MYVFVHSNNRLFVLNIRFDKIKNCIFMCGKFRLVQFSKQVLNITLVPTETYKVIPTKLVLIQKNTQRKII